MPSGFLRRFASFVAVVAAGQALPAAADSPARRWFPDRPVAWDENDAEHVDRAPEPTHLQELDLALLIRDSLAGEADRALALDAGRPAEDVNALDEVPCSTWFCPRNHLRPMPPAAVAAGPPVFAPRPPLRITKGKDNGVTAGFQVRDAAGRKFMLKFDPAGHVGLTTGAEMVGERIFHAAGYNVPGAFLVDLAPADLIVDPAATFRLHGVESRPLTDARVRALLAGTGRLADGRIRAVATPWLPGKILGGFDMTGRRPDDPNDRVPHEHRRSLRASWVLFAWLAEIDAGSINSLDSYVEEAGRRFVRHYVIDFGATLGSASWTPKGVKTGEYLIEVGRTLRALASLGLYRRSFQNSRDEWQRAVAERPSVGWFPADSFDPDAFRTNNKVPAHMRRTDRDLYWGAKLVTSFSDAQLAAVVATAGLAAADAAYLERALRVRRDIIGHRYLRAVAAIEHPSMAPDGSRVCFEDLALARGYARPVEARYLIEVTDGTDGRIATYQQGAAGPVTCVWIGDTERHTTGYRIVGIRTQFTATAGGAGTNVSKAARLHLRWRDGDRRFVLVGLERDE
jgi:hypothetical protein